MTCTDPVIITNNLLFPEHTFGIERVDSPPGGGIPKKIG